ncbi:MAG TPA: TIGR03086 family metal-binding protein [Acidimicrobiales bacterium]|nr:TIGR03086 family metal-binding protein [Acidimicrobiales bacterium]
MADDQLERAFASTLAVMANVDVGMLDTQTPCQSWKVRQLINHMIAAPRVGISALRTGEFHPDDNDYASGDFVAAYEATAKDAVAAFGEAGALERVVKLPFGEVPGAFLRGMVTTDQFTHGWDLARATGQSTDLDPALANELLAQAAIPEQFRGADGSAPFGPEQTAPEGATRADRLAAHLGRHV